MELAFGPLRIAFVTNGDSRRRPEASKPLFRRIVRSSTAVELCSQILGLLPVEGAGDNALPV
jgi:hypothetical protein